MAGVGYLAAFLGGALALISPCSALLLPSFFAYAFTRPARLMARTGAFYAGLAATLVPLGLGSSAVSELFYGHRQALVLAAGWAVIVLGVVQALGGGFAIGPAVRWQAAAQRRLAGRGGQLAVFGLGASYGLAGFCSGPILGAVLTVAAALGNPVGAAALLAVYALGMTAPMFALALAWDRFRLGRRAWLRGRSWRLGPFHLHSTMLASGLLFIVIGVLFLRYDGTAGLTGMLGLGNTTGAEDAAQQWVLRLHAPNWLVLGTVAAAVLGAAVWRLRRYRAQPPVADDHADGPAGSRDRTLAPGQGIRS